MSDGVLVELLVSVGIGLVIVGVGVIYWPAALIVAGLFLLGLVTLAAVLDEPHNRTDPEGRG